MDDLPPILIAEDNDDDFFFFRRAVRAAGIESPLLRFRDGAELVSFVEKNAGAFNRSLPPVLVFLDLAMPIMNGFEALAWLCKHGRGHFKVVVLSGSRREEDVKRAYDEGAEEYLVKPISPVILAAIMARIPQVV